MQKSHFHSSSMLGHTSFNNSMIIISFLTALRANHYIFLKAAISATNEKHLLRH